MPGPRQTPHPVRVTRPRPGRVPRQRSVPPPSSTGGSSTGTGWCLLFVAAGLLVVSSAVALTPLAAKVWTRAWIPAADRLHYGDLLAPALAAVMFGLYLTMSVALAAVSRRRTQKQSGPSVPTTR